MFAGSRAHVPGKHEKGTCNGLQKALGAAPGAEKGEDNMRRSDAIRGRGSTRRSVCCRTFLTSEPFSHGHHTHADFKGRVLTLLLPMQGAAEPSLSRRFGYGVVPA